MGMRVFLFVVTVMFFSPAFAIDSSLLMVVGNCDANKNKTGLVSEVWTGHDNNNASFISFAMLVDGDSTGEISVYRTLNDATGRADYTLLMTALTTQLPLKITNCTYNQFSGGVLSSAERIR